MNQLSVKCLNDLNQFRSAPTIDSKQASSILKELEHAMKQAEWFTIGIMADSEEEAILSLRKIEAYFAWVQMRKIKSPNKKGPVFLKANQQSGDVSIRIEHGLGKGILLAGQSNDSGKNFETWGPFPLDFFK